MNNDIFNEPWEAPPISVNEQGTKWWIDESSNAYIKTQAKIRNIRTDLKAFFVETKHGERSRLLVRKDAVVESSPGLEAFGALIDKWILIESMKRKARTLTR